jgi:hypothetical protein
MTSVAAMTGHSPGARTHSAFDERRAKTSRALVVQRRLHAPDSCIERAITRGRARTSRAAEERDERARASGDVQRRGCRGRQRRRSPRRAHARGWPGSESNRPHADFQSAALPTELPGPTGSARSRSPHREGGQYSADSQSQRVRDPRTGRRWVGRRRLRATEPSVSRPRKIKRIDRSTRTTLIDRRASGFVIAPLVVATGGPRAPPQARARRVGGDLRRP